jgi:hypothetical protein
VYKYSSHASLSQRVSFQFVLINRAEMSVFLVMIYHIGILCLQDLHFHSVLVYIQIVCRFFMFALLNHRCVCSSMLFSIDTRLPPVYSEY